MPTYEYRCGKGHTFEVLQRMSQRPRAKCPTCGRPASRVISGGAGLIFKGSGFYITDYGKDGKGPRKAETEPAAPTEGASKAEAAPDAKATAKPDKVETPSPKKAEKKKDGGKASE